MKLSASLRYIFFLSKVRAVLSSILLSFRIKCRTLRRIIVKYTAFVTYFQDLLKTRVVLPFLLFLTHLSSSPSAVPHLCYLLALLSLGT